MLLVIGISPIRFYDDVMWHILQWWWKLIKEISDVLLNVSDMAFIRVVTSAGKNVCLESSTRKCSEFIFHGIYPAKIIVWNNNIRIWRWIHVFCGRVIMDTITIRVGVYILTRFIFIVVSVDFFLHTGSYLFVMWKYCA